jgi:hypothetical protein
MQRASYFHHKIASSPDFMARSQNHTYHWAQFFYLAVAVRLLSLLIVQLLPLLLLLWRVVLRVVQLLLLVRVVVLAGIVVVLLLRLLVLVLTVVGVVLVGSACVGRVT